MISEKVDRTIDAYGRAMYGSGTQGGSPGWGAPVERAALVQAIEAEVAAAHLPPFAFDTSTSPNEGSHD